MNRFRSRKKSHGEGGDGSRRPSMDSDVPSLPSFSSRTFRKKKKTEPDPMPQLDVQNALPPTDDFRTSLLMPNLSARFSMLREQDDPTSKIGKANDDSVLFPKRASRLELFNNVRAGLSDIAEIDPVRGASVPRPPFASIRTESYNSDATDDGSMISRARPGEGNTMFGGRQKIFKIPVGQAGSVKTFGHVEESGPASRKNMGGKALYESDTFPSAFQLAREREKMERQDQDGTGSEHSNTRTSKEQDRSGSPPMPRYNRNRETSSSTNSGPTQSRASTAATSIASQKSVYGAHEAINGIGHGSNPPGSASSERPLPKGKKMYGQGFDQHHLDQQSSSLHRINSLTRQRGGVPRNLTHSKSATNMNDKYQNKGGVYTSNGIAAASPSPSPTPPRMQEFDLGLSDESNHANHVDSGYGKSPTISPSMSPNMAPVQPDATLVAALEPNDLGKATASGAFNKPAKQYNEQQYLQRQLQLQEGRNTPSPAPSSRPFSPPNIQNSDPMAGRSRNNSQGSQFSRNNSMKHVWEHHMEDRVLRPVPERGRSPSVQNSNRNSTQNSIRDEPDEPSSGVGQRTFFGGMSGSEIGSNPESESEADPNSPIPSTGKSQGFRQPGPPPTSQTKPQPLGTPFNFELNNHQVAELGEGSASDSRSYRSEKTVTQSQYHENGSNSQGRANQLDNEPPMLGPESAQNGLSGMVHQHLRNVSGTSSVYPEDSPRRSRPEVRESIFGHESALNQQDSSRDSASFTDSFRTSIRQSDQSIPPIPQPLSFAARQILEQTAALKHQDSTKAKQLLGNDKAQRVLGGEAPRPSHESTSSWPDQLRAHHTRGGSTETQMEQESLANELEARKRIVRNNLQTFAEGESRDASPARGVQNFDGPPSQPFGFLRKSSATPPINKQEKPTKAMKMLGLDLHAAPEPEEPPHDLLIGREQYPDRAGPPNQKVLKPRPRDLNQNSDESPTKSKRGFFGSRSHQNSRRTSPHSSKSGSDGSDRRPHSRKSSTGKSSAMRNGADNFGVDGAYPSVETWNGVSTTKGSMDVSRPSTRDAQRPRTPISNANKMRTNSKPSPPQARPIPFEQRAAPPGTPVMINPSTRPSVHPHSYGAHSHPSMPYTQSQFSMTHPAMINPQNPHPPPTSHNSPRAHRGRSINKQDISEPTFISTTSTFDTVDLPPGASLSNGMDEVSLPNSAPPIPSRDSRRKRTPNLFHAFGGRSDRRPESPMTSPTMKKFVPLNGEDGAYDERGVFTGNVPSTSRPGTSSGRPRTRGGSNEDAIQENPPAMPISPQKNLQVAQGEPPTMVAERHIPYQAQQDVPASAVMF